MNSLTDNFRGLSQQVERVGGILLPIVVLLVLLVSGGIFAYNHLQRDQEEFELRRAHRALSLLHAQELGAFELALGVQERIQVDVEAEIDQAAGQGEPNLERLQFLQRSRQESIDNQHELREEYHAILTEIEEEIHDVVQALNERGYSVP